MLVSIAVLDYQRVSETKHDAIVIGEHSRKMMFWCCWCGHVWNIGYLLPYLG